MSCKYNRYKSCTYESDYTYDDSENATTTAHTKEFNVATDTFTYADRKEIFNCGLPTINGSCFCEYHKCNVVNCTNHITFASKYCDLHTCVFELPNGQFCYQQTINDSKYCSQHQCLTCSDDDESFAEHEDYVCYKDRCKYPSCKQHRMYDESIMGDPGFSTVYCENHYLLDDLYQRYYGLNLHMTDALNFLDSSDLVESSSKVKLLKRLKECADNFCK